MRRRQGTKPNDEELSNESAGKEHPGVKSHQAEVNL